MPARQLTTALLSEADVEPQVQENASPYCSEAAADRADQRAAHRLREKLAALPVATSASLSSSCHACCVSCRCEGCCGCCMPRMSCSNTGCCPCMCDTRVLAITVAILLWGFAACLLLVSALMSWLWMAVDGFGRTVKFGMVYQEEMSTFQNSPDAFIAVWHAVYWILLVSSAATGALTALRLYKQQRGMTRPVLLYLLPSLSGACTLLTAVVFVSLNEAMRGVLLTGSIAGDCGGCPTPSASPVVSIRIAPDAYTVMWTAICFMPLAFASDIWAWRALLKDRDAAQRADGKQLQQQQEQQADDAAAVQEA
jgi:hypothetical protein